VLVSVLELAGAAAIDRTFLEDNRSWEAIEHSVSKN
jgi:hypothetical protein